MKRLTKKNICMSSWCQVVAVCIFASQIIHLGDAQSTTDATTTDINDQTTEFSNISATDCPMCNLSEMPMELAEKINEISDVDEFIHDFVNISSTDFTPARRKRAASNNLRQATCQPIDTLITTVPADERDPSVFYFPSCVLVKQCGGCCAHSGTTCTPTDEVERTVTVKKTKYVNNSAKLMNLGDISVTVKEHNKCRCQCRKTAADCNSLQRFIKNQCRCECVNKDEEERCVQSYPKKLFDSSSCQCVCRDTKECGTGFHFDQSTCGCEPITYHEEDEELLFADHGQNSETYEATDEIKYETESADATSEQ